MVQPRKLPVVVLGALAMAVAPGAAQADSIAYIKEANVWIAKPDGSDQHLVTTNGTRDAPYRSVTQDDKGVLLAARGKRIVRMRQDGSVLNTLQVAAPSGNGVAASEVKGPLPDDEVSPPDDVHVTPDGTKVVFWFVGRCYESTGGIFGYQPCPLIAASYTDRFTKPSELTGPNFPEGWFPRWVGNARYVEGNDGSTELYVGDAPVPNCSPDPSCHTAYWLTNCYTANGVNTCDGASESATTRDGHELAVVATDSQAQRYRLVLYTSPGVPADGNPNPASGGKNGATPQCYFGDPAGGAFATPDFAPDGSGIAWDEADGIHVVRGDVAGICGATSSGVTIPGGRDPSWGPADVAPVVAPKLSALRVSPRRVRSGHAAKLRFTLSKPAAVAVLIQRRSGRHWVDVRQMVGQARRGANTVTIPARVKGKPLKPGRYRALLAAADIEGNTSARRMVSFRVI